MGGFNQGKYTGKYSGSAGKNSGRNPQPGWGGGGGGSSGNKGCWDWFFGVMLILVGVPTIGIYIVMNAFFGG